MVVVVVVVVLQRRLVSFHSSSNVHYDILINKTKTNLFERIEEANTKFVRGGRHRRRLG